MPLRDYRSIRNFSSTSEPKGQQKKKTNSKKDSKSGRSLVFVVQKHYASHLHYDFRLELEGVLKSWAIPKGPSLDPSNKHLAVLVEDHSFEYKDFSGIIPEGDYGAGKVEIWDKGTYTATGAKDKTGTEVEVKKGLEKGRITILLKGRKLNGEFTFIRFKKAKGNNWLLIKKNDEFAI